MNLKAISVESVKPLEYLRVSDKKVPHFHEGIHYLDADFNCRIGAQN